MNDAISTYQQIHRNPLNSQHMHGWQGETKPALQPLVSCDMASGESVTVIAEVMRMSKRDAWEVINILQLTPEHQRLMDEWCRKRLEQRDA